MTWDERVEAMRGVLSLRSGGVFEDADHPTWSPPVRYARLEFSVALDDAPAVAAGLAVLAVRIDGYLTMNVHDTHAALSVAISRPLTAQPEVSQ